MKRESALTRFFAPKSPIGSGGKSASMSNINRVQAVPLKSILKKASMASVTVNEETAMMVGKTVKIDGSDEDGVSAQLSDPNVNAPVPLSLQDRLIQDASNAQSSPNLTLARHGQLQTVGSNKNLQFNLEHNRVIETHSKDSYNRKSGNDMTFKHLTPKLKDEIREELNEFKRKEMSVHELSTSYTVFH